MAEAIWGRLDDCMERLRDCRLDRLPLLDVGERPLRADSGRLLLDGWGIREVLFGWVRGRWVRGLVYPPPCGDSGGLDQLLGSPTPRSRSA